MFWVTLTGVEVRNKDLFYTVHLRFSVQYYWILASRVYIPDSILTVKTPVNFYKKRTPNSVQVVLPESYYYY